MKNKKLNTISGALANTAKILCLLMMIYGLLDYSLTPILFVGLPYDLAVEALQDFYNIDSDSSVLLAMLHHAAHRVSFVLPFCLHFTLKKQYLSGNIVDKIFFIAGGCVFLPLSLLEFSILTILQIHLSGFQHTMIHLIELITGLPFYNGLFILYKIIIMSIVFSFYEPRRLFSVRTPLLLQMSMAAASCSWFWPAASIDIGDEDDIFKTRETEKNAHRDENMQPPPSTGC